VAARKEFWSVAKITQSGTPFPRLPLREAGVLLRSSTLSEDVSGFTLDPA
jgi:hypothetical protein